MHNAWTAKSLQCLIDNLLSGLGRIELCDCAVTRKVFTIVDPGEC
jgi:hypothetical protein